MHYSFLIVTLLIVPLISFGNQDTLRASFSSNESVVGIMVQKPHTPAKAALYSALLPGAGQVYNKKYWKVPIIYGTAATFIYFISRNNSRFIRYQNANSDLIDNDPTTNSYLDLPSAQGVDLSIEANKTALQAQIVKQRDQFKRNRDLFIIGTVVIYTLNILDAVVDAHFFDFDLSEKLSMSWSPSYVIGNFGTQNLTLNVVVRRK